MPTTNLVEFAQELKRQVPIDQLIGEYVPSLQRRGSSIKALCPFHEEKTPSFTVNPEFGFYHCFGCGAHGTAIKFIQEFEKVDFRLAVETLARRFDVAIPEFKGQLSPEKRDEAEQRRKLLLEICRLAQKYFVHQLWNHPQGEGARAYLASRGLSDEQIKTYELGLAPAGYEAFLKVARKHGYKDSSVAEAGLASAKDRGGHIDRFRNRIIFPIHDARGDVVAFGGRLVDGEGPKYLNSADTPLFHKGQLLYGLKAARPAIRDTGRAVLVEGYMDWIALHSNGIENVVAGLGTAFGPEQARLLSRMTSEVIVLYDGDEAGQKAMFRAGEHLLGQGLSAFGAGLPADDDPDTFIRAHGAEAMQQKIADAPPVIEFFLERALERFPSGTAQDKIQAVEFLAPLLRAIPKPEHREAFASELRVRLGIHQAEVFTQGVQRGRGWGSEEAPRPGRPPSAAGARPAESAPGGAPGPNLAPEGLRAEDRLQLRYLNRLVSYVEHWEYFEDADAELFTHREYVAVFTRIHATARDVREGAPPPDDWLAVCEDETERQILIRALMFEELYLSGELQKREPELSPEERAKEFQELKTRLRRLKKRRLRSEQTHRFRLQPASYEEDRPHLARFVDHSKSVIRETETLFQSDSPSAQANPGSGR